LTRFAPAISVLLPVFNGSPYLSEAIESILNQTWKDFELIILNDGSKDNSAGIVHGYEDPRIRYYEHENIGLGATLNRGIGLSAGVFIARQDQDDISRPERFGRQMTYLTSHPECVLVGTWADIWSEERDTGRTLRHPTENALIQLDLLFDNPFVHSSVMIRKKSIQEAGGYSVDPMRQPPEDFELWSRMSLQGEMANIAESLVIYREVGGSMSRTTDPVFWGRVLKICSGNIQAVLGDRYDRDLIHGAVCLLLNLDSVCNPPGVRQLAALMNDLANVMKKRFPYHGREIRIRLMEYYYSMLLRIFIRSSGRYVAALRARCCMHLFIR